MQVFPIFGCLHPAMHSIQNATLKAKKLFFLFLFFFKDNPKNKMFTKINTFCLQCLLFAFTKQLLHIQY